MKKLFTHVVIETFTHFERELFSTILEVSEIA